MYIVETLMPGQANCPRQAKVFRTLKQANAYQKACIYDAGFDMFLVLVHYIYRTDLA